MQNINISVRGESVLHYGMKIYVIDELPYTDRAFAEKCIICNDEMEIEIKGYKFPCPMCQGSVSQINHSRISLYDFTVFDYIINDVHIEGSDYKSDYKPDSDKLPFAEWRGFARWGKGYNDTRRRKISDYDFKEKSIEDFKSLPDAIGCCFYKRADAVKFCKELHERQKELLDQFNLEHGTEHKYPFEF